jgi:hypothetical protein
MDIRTERETVIRTEHLEVYEPPLLDEIGGFNALTRADASGSLVDGTGYYPE